MEYNVGDTAVSPTTGKTNRWTGDAWVEVKPIASTTDNILGEVKGFGAGLLNQVDDIASSNLNIAALPGKVIGKALGAGDEAPYRKTTNAVAAEHPTAAAIGAAVPQVAASVGAGLATAGMGIPAMIATEAAVGAATTPQAPVLGAAFGAVGGGLAGAAAPVVGTLTNMSGRLFSKFGNKPLSMIQKRAVVDANNLGIDTGAQTGGDWTSRVGKTLKGSSAADDQNLSVLNNQIADEVGLPKGELITPNSLKIADKKVGKEYGELAADVRDDNDDFWTLWADNPNPTSAHIIDNVIKKDAKTVTGADLIKIQSQLGKAANAKREAGDIITADELDAHREFIQKQIVPKGGVDNKLFEALQRKYANIRDLDKRSTFTADGKLNPSAVRKNIKRSSSTIANTALRVEENATKPLFASPIAKTAAGVGLGGTLGGIFID